MTVNIWHIAPQGDTEEHDLISEYHKVVDHDGNIYDELVCQCHCEPTIVDENDNMIIVHNAFDGRKSCYFQTPKQ